MNREFLRQFFNAFQAALEKRRPEIAVATGRFPKQHIFLALNDCKELFRQTYNCPVTSRWSVGEGVGDSRRPDTQVLEYLVDYGICRHSIPQALRQPKIGLQELGADEKYRMLLAVESEMGDDTEVARDFLKLLDVKAPVKFLIYKRRKSYAALYERLSWVLKHHGAHDEAESILLVGVPKPKDATLAVDEFEVKCVEGTLIVAL